MATNRDKTQLRVLMCCSLILRFRVFPCGKRYRISAEEKLAKHIIRPSFLFWMFLSEFVCSLNCATFTRIVYFLSFRLSRKLGDATVCGAKPLHHRLQNLRVKHCRSCLCTMEWRKHFHEGAVQAFWLHHASCMMIHHGIWSRRTPRHGSTDRGLF